MQDSERKLQVLVYHASEPNKRVPLAPEALWEGDVPTIGVLAACVFGVFAVCMVLPLLAAVIEGNWPAVEALVLIVSGYGFVALATVLAVGPRRRVLNRAGVFTTAIVLWGSLVVAATPPFILVEGQGVAKALFEASSAVATLGVTLLPAQDISAAMIFYRGTVGWLGGLLTLTLAVYILGPYQVGGIPNANLRRVQHARTERDPRIGETLRSIAGHYAAWTVLCAGLLILVRVPADEAIVVAMSMLSTNGFMPAQTGGGVLDNPAAQIVMMAFMVIGATSIVWHRLVASRTWGPSRDQSEAMLYISALGFLAILAVLASLFAQPQERTGLESALVHVFDIISIATTTGITHAGDSGINIPFELVLLIVFVGGCSYSTAGGIKVFRLAAMLRHVGNELERLVYPSAVLPGDALYDARQREIAKAIWSAFFLALLTLTAAILIFSAQGYMLPDAIALGMGSFSQAGNLIGQAVPDLHLGAVSNGTLLTISLFALIARIEILVVLAALAGNRW